MGERRWTVTRCSSCGASASVAPKRPKTAEKRKGWSEPPDAVHEWLSSVQAAELLGVSTVAVNRRCRRGRLPFVEKAGRRWFRRDHPELVKRADLGKRPKPGN